ncbi:MAG: hypothetical protein O7G86_07025 [Gammaproteobacteria bacterium]|nr:hypothetical protein [Gammaproteobacteria bacterium]
MGDAYLPFLNANAQAWHNKQRVFDADIQGAPYRNMPVSQYRVWCLEQLKDHFYALPEPTRAEAQTLLEAQGCLEPLLLMKNSESGYDREGNAPFRGRRVHYDNKG